MHCNYPGSMRCVCSGAAFRRPVQSSMCIVIPPGTVSFERGFKSSAQASARLPRASLLSSGEPLVLLRTILRSRRAAEVCEG